MAIQWGNWNGKLRAGVDATWSGPTASQSSVKVTWHFYIQCANFFNFRDNQVARISGDGFNAYNVNYRNTLNSNQQMKIGSKTVSYNVSSTSTTSKSATIRISQSFNNSNPSKSRTITIAKRPANRPSASTNVNIDRITSSSCRVTWGNPSNNGGAAINNHNVQIATNSGFTAGKKDRTTFPSREWNFTGQKANTKHWVRVRSGNSAGWGPWAVSKTFTTSPPPVSTPSAPLNLTNQGMTPTSISLSWNPPSSSGGAALNQYGVQISKQSNFSSLERDIKGIIPPVATTTATGITKNTQYYARVRAGNSGGWGPWSATLAFKTPFDVPTAPTNFVYTLLEPDIVIFGWGPPVDDGGQPVTKYQLQTDSWEGDFSSPSNDVDVVQGYMEHAVNLDLMQRHIARVRAVSSAGNGAWSRVVDTETIVYILDPPGPVNVGVLGVTRTSLTLLLTAENQDTEITYEYEVSTDPGFNFDDTADELWSGIWDPMGNRIVLENLSAETVYYIRARASNSGGLGPWGQAVMIETKSALVFESEAMLSVYIRKGSGWRRTNIHATPQAAVIPRLLEPEIVEDPTDRWWETYPVGQVDSNAAAPMVYQFGTAKQDEGILPVRGDLVWAWISSNNVNTKTVSVDDSSGTIWTRVIDAPQVSQRAVLFAGIAVRDYLDTDTLIFRNDADTTAAKIALIFGCGGVGMPPLGGGVNSSGTNQVSGNSGAISDIAAPALILGYLQTGSGGGDANEAFIDEDDVFDTLFRMQALTNQFVNQVYLFTEEGDDRASSVASFGWTSSNAWSAGIAAFPLLPKLSLEEL